METGKCKKLNLQQFKALFIIVTAVVALLAASPLLQRILVYPQTEFFTEFSLLGPGHMAQNYPYNITQIGTYAVFLGITNNLGSCAYYQVQVKFRNETQSAPDSFNLTPSSLPSLYNIAAFVADKESLELPVTFIFSYSFANVDRSVYSNVTVPNESGQNSTIEQIVENVTARQAVFNSIIFNGVSLSLAGLTSDQDSNGVWIIICIPSARPLKPLFPRQSPAPSRRGQNMFVC